MERIVQDIIESLESLADEKRIAFAKTSYPTKLKVIGVTNPSLKIVLKAMKTQIKAWEPVLKLELAKALINTQLFECQQLAYELLDKDYKTLTLLDDISINALGKNMDNWVMVDYYAALIVGYAWRVEIITIDKVMAFLKSDNFWIRRIALVATVSLNQKARGGTGDTKQTLIICELCINDHEDMINKALSWALRELSKRDKTSVEVFIDKHEKNLHPRVLREVKNKLDKGTKN